MNRIGSEPRICPTCGDGEEEWSQWFIAEQTRRLKESRRDMVTAIVTARSETARHKNLLQSRGLLTLGAGLLLRDIFNSIDAAFDVLTERDCIV